MPNKNTKTKIIGILGAMNEEIEPLLEYFGHKKKHIFASNAYYEIEYKGLTIFLAYSKIGKVFSSLTASVLILKFGCEKILFSGVAGSINPKLNIFDILVANKLAQHDLDISESGDHPYGYVPGGKIFYEPCKNLILLAKTTAKQNGINLIDATIVTGDQFIISKEKKAWILKHFQADALEMEGASVGVVCENLNIPYLIIRTISDKADDDSNIAFDKFLAKSAKTSAKLIIHIINDMIKQS
jgi:adenosylhomocysteine/aminodeoxyfutalosine nucleosidase